MKLKEIVLSEICLVELLLLLPETKQNRIAYSWGENQFKKIQKRKRNALLHIINSMYLKEEDLLKSLDEFKLEEISLKQQIEEIKKFVDQNIKLKLKNIEHKEKNFRQIKMPSKKQRNIQAKPQTKFIRYILFYKTKAMKQSFAKREMLIVQFNEMFLTAEQQKTFQIEILYLRKENEYIKKLAQTSDHTRDKSDFYKIVQQLSIIEDLNNQIRKLNYSLTDAEKELAKAKNQISSLTSDLTGMIQELQVKITDKLEENHKERHYLRNKKQKQKILKSQRNKLIVTLSIYSLQEQFEEKVKRWKNFKKQDFAKINQFIVGSDETSQQSRLSIFKILKKKIKIQNIL